jgi:ABC-type methionine transport system ATPase subunit
MFATSIRENLVYGMRGHQVPSEEQIMKSLKMANVHSFIMSLPEKLDTYCGPGGSQMSGGQKQRIAIARALLREPQVLLLDEATSALDNESEKLVQQTIDSLQANFTQFGGRNLTTISVAHRLSTVRNSDVIFVLQRGVLMEQGNHQFLMGKADGVYKALVSTQAAAAGVEHQPDKISVPGERKISAGDDSMIPESAGVEMSKTIPLASKTAEEIEKARISTISKKYKVPWGRLLSFTKQEKWLYVPGILGAFAKGAAFPIHAMMFSAVISWYYEKDDLCIKSVSCLLNMSAWA